MAEQFDAYEAELKGLLENIERGIRFLNDAVGERRKVAVNETERALEEARSVLRKMGPVARDLPQRAQLQMRIRGYDSDLQRLERSLLVAVPTPGARAGSGLEDAEAGLRDKLRAGVDRLDRTGARLEHTEVVAHETEAIGVSVISDLHGQREVLEGVDTKLSVVDDNTSRARRMLINMARRIATNKLILALIIFVQLFTVFLIVFFKWIYPHLPSMKSDA
jgi:vesicle transport through interaction with t-SNAREs protein 1